MTISEIANKIEGILITENSYIQSDLKFAFASDLMSDVLTITSTNLVLITGLANIQTIRTAEMAEIKTIVLVRDKKVDNEMLSLANKLGIYIITTNKTMFHVCGLLFAAGLQPIDLAK